MKKIIYNPIFAIALTVVLMIVSVLLNTRVKLGRQCETLCNQFYGDADITAYMDNWYQNLGVQAIFACGGGIYTSVAEAAVKVDGAKVIGVDVDQASIIDGIYGEGLTLTSAMKGLSAAINLKQRNKEIIWHRYISS